MHSPHKFHIAHTYGAFNMRHVAERAHRRTQWSTLMSSETTLNTLGTLAIAFVTLLLVWLVFWRPA